MASVNRWATGTRDLGRRLSQVSACFFFVAQVPSSITGVDVCEAAEATSGFGSIVGAQKMGSLWRIYPKTKTARDALLTEGLCIHGTSVQVLDSNPLLLYGTTELPTVKVTIGNIPMSVSNIDIEKAIKQIPGVKVVSKLYDECYRREGGELTRWKSGRRYCYVQRPDTPLPSTFELDHWRPTLYHYGQPRVQGGRSGFESHTAPSKSDLFHLSATDLIHSNVDNVDNGSVTDSELSHDEDDTLTGPDSLQKDVEWSRAHENNNTEIMTEVDDTVTSQVSQQQDRPSDKHDDVETTQCHDTSAELADAAFKAPPTPRSRTMARRSGSKDSGRSRTPTPVRSTKRQMSGESSQPPPSGKVAKSGGKEVESTQETLDSFLNFYEIEPSQSTPSIFDSQTEGE